MKILMIHPHDVFSKEEPWTTRITNLARELKSLGHEIKLVYFPLDFQSQKRFVLEGMEFIPASRRLGLRQIWNNLRLLRNEADWADIIHFQKCFYYAALPAILAAYFKNKPLHYDWDDWELKIFNFSARQPKLIEFLMWALERFIPGLCETVSVSSQRLRQECRRYGVPEERIFSAPVGADLRRFNPAVSGVRIRERYNITWPIVIYLGQLHGGQYAEQFIRAAKIVLNTAPKVMFMIVGGGYRLEELKAMSREMSLENNLIFTGSLPQSQIPLYLAASDAAVACFEDNEITQCKSPLKIAEYMAAGKPIVASDVGEVKRMLGGAGIIVPPGDPEALAQGILKILDDEPLRKRLSREARQRAESLYSWGNTAQNLCAAYGLNLGISHKQHESPND